MGISVGSELVEDIKIPLSLPPKPLLSKFCPASTESVWQHESRSIYEYFQPTMVNSTKVWMIAVSLCDGTTVSPGGCIEEGVFSIPQRQANMRF